MVEMGMAYDFDISNCRISLTFTDTLSEFEWILIGFCQDFCLLRVKNSAKNKNNQYCLKEYLALFTWRADYSVKKSSVKFKGNNCEPFSNTHNSSLPARITRMCL
jgi:hypothetical protein